MAGLEILLDCTFLILPPLLVDRMHCLQRRWIQQRSTAEWLMLYYALGQGSWSTYLLNTIHVYCSCSAVFFVSIDLIYWSHLKPRHGMLSIYYIDEDAWLIMHLFCVLIFYTKSTWAHNSDFKYIWVQFSVISIIFWDIGFAF